MYTQAFKEAVAYCKANNLFVGYGNPNGKVLVIGKEAVHIGKEVPNYGSERPISHENPLYAYLNQYNSWDKSKKGETSRTYLSYKKVYEQLFLQGEKLEKINFQKEFFITEFSDYPTKEATKMRIYWGS